MEIYQRNRKRTSIRVLGIKFQRNTINNKNKLKLMATDCLDKMPIRLTEPIQDGDRWITYVNVPCGKCARCLQRKKMEWSFRMNEEMKVSKTALFVTLTYDPEHVPINKYGFKTLIPDRATDLKIKAEIEGRKRITKKFKRQSIDRSLSGFFKRLRRYQERGPYTMQHYANGLRNSDKIKYFACGEYGEQRGRPHYHAIIFNTSEKAIEEAWRMGQTHVVKATEETIAYTMKYMDKRLGAKQDWRKVEEFHTMSEGLGEAWIDRNRQWYERNIDIIYCKSEKGFLVPMPKWYRLKLFNEEQRKEQIKLIGERLDEVKYERIEKIGETDYIREIKMKRSMAEKRFKKQIKPRNTD